LVNNNRSAPNSKASSAKVFAVFRTQTDVKELRQEAFDGGARRTMKGEVPRIGAPGSAGCKAKAEG